MSELAMSNGKNNGTAAPMVSVIICAYNAAPFIAQTLASVWAQSYTDYEVIVVNDGSTDETAAVLQPFADRITYLEQPNQGPAAARNTALRAARGTYIAILDSDDLWLPQYLATMVEYLQTHPDVDLYYPNAVLFGLPHLEGKIYQELYPSSQPVTLEKLLARECQVFGLVTFRRALLEQVGLYDEELRGVEDLDLWLRMLQHGARFSFTSEVLAQYRRHKTSLSVSTIPYFQQVIQTLRKFQAAATTTTQQHQLAEQFCQQVEAEKNLLLTKRELVAGNYHLARYHLRQVLARRTSWTLRLAWLGLRFSPQLLALVARRATPTATRSHQSMGPPISCPSL